MLNIPDYRNKFLKNKESLSSCNFVRKCIFVAIRMFEFSIYRKIKYLFFFKTLKVKVGKNVRIIGLPINIKIGKGTEIYDNCIFEFGHNSNFVIEGNTTLSYGVLISCRDRIKIGREVQIGEYTSIRDSTHNYTDNSIPIKMGQDILNEIEIGDDVWIGRGCIVMPGTIIENRVIVGANSVVKGKLSSNWIYAGVPAKPIKKISSSIE